MSKNVLTMAAAVLNRQLECRNLRSIADVVQDFAKNTVFREPLAIAFLPHNTIIQLQAN